MFVYCLGNQENDLCIVPADTETHQKLLATTERVSKKNVEKKQTGIENCDNSAADVVRAVTTEIGECSINNKNTTEKISMLDDVFLQKTGLVMAMCEKVYENSGMV